MIQKSSIAIALTATLALVIVPLALAAGPAQVVFTTDTPCPVNVILTSYTDPANQPGQIPGGSTPLTLDTYPLTSVTFFYPAIVDCGGVIYSYVSVSPVSPLTSGDTGTITTVTGHYISDTTPPVWTVPDDFSVEATGLGGAAVTYAASASDPDDAVISQSCSPASGDTFALGITTVKCTATDTHGNIGTATFIVTVVDTTPPVLTLPSDIIVSATSTSGAEVSFVVTANDLVDGPRPVICSPASGSTFSIGTTTVNCSAIDSNDNTATGSFKVTVDDAPPVLTIPSDMTVTATNASGAVVSFVASANDLVDGPRPVTCSPASGSLFSIGTTTVDCSAVDSSNNTAAGSFNVTVQYATAGVNCNGIPGHQILQPINLDGSSIFKAGSTVPAKFRVCGTDGVAIGTPGTVTNFRLVGIVIEGTTHNVDLAVSSTPPHDAFRSGSRQWIFDINTKDLDADNTYIYIITLNDGSSIQFQFTLK